MKTKSIFQFALAFFSVGFAILGQPQAHASGTENNAGGSAQERDGGKDDKREEQQEERREKKKKKKEVQRSSTDKKTKESGSGTEKPSEGARP